MTTQNFGPGIVGGVVLVDPGTGLPYRASASASASADTVETVTLTGDVTFTPSGTWDTSAGHLVLFVQDASGGHVVSWGTSVKVWDGDALPSVLVTDHATTAVLFAWSSTLAGWVPTLWGTSTPPDVAAPTPGTLAGSSQTADSFTLTVTGASDVRALATTPYEFSTDNQVTWSPPQLAATFDVSGLTAATAYQCAVRVTDGAGNTAVATATVSTTTAAATLVGTHTALSTNVTDGTSFSFPGLSLGAADTTRKMIVVVAYRGANVEPTVTLGGNAVTKDYAAVLSPDGTYTGVWFGRIAVPTGTTADVAVTFPSSVTKCGVELRAITGASTLTLVGSDGKTNTAGASVTNPANGLVVAAAINSTTTLTITGSTKDATSAAFESFYLIAGQSATTGTVVAQSGTLGVTGAVVYAGTV